MWETVRLVVADVLQDLRQSWRDFAITDIAYKVVAFAALTPATMLVMRFVMFEAEGRVIADVDIATFFLTRPIGILTLVLGGALIIGITALEIACLMAIGIAAAKGGAINAKEALAFGAARALPVLRLTANMVLRLLLGLLPFLLVAGIVYPAILREYDINYYIAIRPPEFWMAVVIAVTLLVSLVALLVRTIARWAQALPLVLFENVVPGRALSESSSRTTGVRPLIILVLAAWAVMTVLVLFWGALGVVAGIVNAALFALAIVRLYLRAGDPRPQLPTSTPFDRTYPQMSRSALVSAVIVLLLAAVGFALQRLEEKVVDIVEAAGMAQDSIFMSLDHDMVRKIKQLRPSWRAGVLVAKAIGDLTSLRADFLAVEARLATRAFVRQAHRAGQDVYVWTVNDPAWMLAAMSNGVDGLITDKPDVARLVVERRTRMTDAQRIVVALLVRFGARVETLTPEDALRP